MNLADDFKTNVHDDATLRAFLERHNLDVPVGDPTHAISLVYRHKDGRYEALVTMAPEHPSEATAYVIAD